MPVRQDYYSITPDKWDAILAAAAGYGIQITADQGKGESFGVKLAWSYSRVEKNLTIAILDAGFLGDDEALKFVDGIIRNP